MIVCPHLLDPIRRPRVAPPEYLVLAVVVRVPRHDDAEAVGDGGGAGDAQAGLPSAVNHIARVGGVDLPALFPDPRVLGENYHPLVVDRGELGDAVALVPLLFDPRLWPGARQLVLLLRKYRPLADATISSRMSKKQKAHGAAFSPPRRALWRVDAARVCEVASERCREGTFEATTTYEPSPPATDVIKKPSC